MNDGQVVISGDGTVLHYDTVGDGEPLLLLAGGPGIDPVYIYPVADHCAKTRKCFILHQRGTGRTIVSDPSPDNVNVKTYVDDIDALRNHLRLENIAVLGHSWGGMLAMAYAARFPNRVNSLVLVCTGGMDGSYLNYLYDNAWSYLSPEEQENVNYWRHPDRPKDANTRQQELRAMSPAAVFDRANASSVADVYGSINPEIETLIWQSVLAGDYNVADAMSKFDKLVTIFAARQDCMGEGIVYQAHATFPVSNLIWIERCGHFPWIDQPEVFYRALSEVLGAK